MAPGRQRPGALNVALTTAAFLTIEIDPCATRASARSRSSSASESNIGAIEGPGNAEPVVHLLKISVLWQVRQAPAHPGLQLWRDITEDLGEVVINDPLAFREGDTREPF